MNLSIRKKNAFVFLFLLLYKFTLDYVYVEFIYPVFSYSGFILHFNFTKYLISIFYFIIVYISLPKNAKKPSFMFLHLHFIIMIAPMFTMYSYANESDNFMLLCTLFFVFQCLVLRVVPNIKITRVQNSKRFLYLIIVIISAFVYIAMIRSNGLPSLKALNLLNVYEVRREVSYPALMGYLVNWQAKIINPFLISIAYINRRRKLLVISIFMQIIIYLMAAHRSFLLIPVAIIIVIKIIEKWDFFVMSSTVASIGVFVSYFAYKIFDNILIPSLFVRRFLFLPAKIKFIYYDFFSRNELLYFSQGLIGKIFGVEYPYDIPRNYMISYLYGGSINSAANTGYLADAYSNMGVLGMFIISLVMIFVFIMIDSLSAKVNKDLVMGLSIFSILGLNDVALLTSLLTGGLMLLLLLLYLYSSYEDEIKDCTVH